MIVSSSKVLRVRGVSLIARPCSWPNKGQGGASFLLLNDRNDFASQIAVGLSQPGPLRRKYEGSQIAPVASVLRDRYWRRLRVTTRSGCGAVDQMGERCNRTAEASGSIPLSSTTPRSADICISPIIDVCGVQPCDLTGNAIGMCCGEWRDALAPGR